MTPREKLRLIALIARCLRSQWWTRERILAYQTDRLERVLRHAVETVPFYRDSVSLPASVPAGQLLQAFTVLTKAQVQQGGNRLLSDDFNEDRLYSSVTSGSTGEPTTTRFDDYSWAIGRHALKARRVLNAARPIGQRLLVVSEQVGAKLDMSLPAWCLRTCSVGMNDSVDDSLRRIAEFRPTIIQGFPSYLAYLAEASAARGRSQPKVPTIFTSSELLTSATRNRIESTFGGKVTDVYGSTEFKEIAVQCPVGRYHINFEHVYVESVRDALSGVWRLLITSLTNRAMPFIRYDIGDVGQIGDDACTCGRQGPYLHSLAGRRTELLRFTDGTVVTPYAITLEIERFAEVHSFTVVHRAPDDIELEIFARPKLSTNRQSAMISAVRRVLPSDVAISIRCLSERPPAGKRIAVRRDFDVGATEP